MNDPRPQNPDLKPKVDVQRGTTKVNLALIVGVLLFLGATFLVVALYERNPAQTRNDQHDKVESRP